MTFIGIGKRRFFFRAFVLFSIVFFVWICFAPKDRRLYLEEKNEISDFDDGEAITSVRWNEEMEAALLSDAQKQVPGLGDKGESVTLPPLEEEKADAVMKKEGFNLILSDKIMYNRTILDARHPECLKMKYPEDLPSASIVIVFTNERWSSLIRTIHSVFNRSPKHLLKELILVDDASDHEELQEKLEYYIATRLPKKITLVRLPKRSGLIKARLEGARQAKGDVLVFLDAHCEVGIDWLQPLLARVKESRNSVVVPIIDVIHDKTFEYQNNGGSYDFELGGFTWSGHFTWIPISQEEERRRGNPYSPTRTPTMAGGLLAIGSKYFWEIGSYDPDMDIWGGENLEMSFRVWQCGGYLETIPCSRVGHIFRNFHPYSFPGNKDTHGINTARMAKVWMDDYKRLFFKHRPELENIDIGNITGRVELRKKLKCKDFKWYLTHIYKSKFILDENVQAYGRVMTHANRLCLDNLQSSEEEKHLLGVYSCHNELYMSQFFSLSNAGELRREFVCAEVSTAKMEVEMYKCHGGHNQKWTYTSNNALMHIDSRLCLDTEGTWSGKYVKVSPCNNSKTQKWSWEFLT